MDYFYSKRYSNLDLTRHVTDKEPVVSDNSLSAGLLLLTLQQCVQTNAINREDTISGPGQVAVSLPFRPSDTLYLNLVMLVDKIQRAIAGQECSYDLSILDDLCADAFSYCAVGLAAFNPHLLQDDRSSLRRSFQWVCFVVETQHTSLVGSIGPPEALTPIPQFAAGEHSA